VFTVIGDSVDAGTLTQLTVVGGPDAVSAGDESLIANAAGITPRGSFTATPTSVPTGGVITIADSASPCPAAPVGSEAFVVAVVVLADGNGASESDLNSAPAPLGGGAWNTTVTIPSGTAPGTYDLSAACATSFPPTDPTEYSYFDYTAIQISVT